MEETYNTGNEEKISTGSESLDKILKTIRPYLPKIPKAINKKQKRITDPMTILTLCFWNIDNE